MKLYSSLSSAHISHAGSLLAGWAVVCVLCCMCVVSGWQKDIQKKGVLPPLHIIMRCFFMSMMYFLRGCVCVCAAADRDQSCDQIYVCLFSIIVVLQKYYCVKNTLFCKQHMRRSRTLSNVNSFGCGRKHWKLTCPVILPSETSINLLKMMNVLNNKCAYYILLRSLT